MHSGTAHDTHRRDVRAGIAAAAAVLGVRIDIVDGEEWSVDGERVRLGLDYVAGATVSRDAVARALLLLWESAREVRLAPERRLRRLALAHRSPRLEALLATLDRLLAAAELVTAMPAFREATVRVVAADLPPNPAELPRHLQWVSYLLLAGVDARAAERLAEQLTPEVGEEVVGLRGLVPGSDVLRAALAPVPGLTPLQRFERVFGVVSPGYERLLALDVERGGLSARSSVGEAMDDAGVDIPEALSPGPAAGDNPEGNASDDAEDSSGASADSGGEAEKSVNDDDSRQARAGDTKESAEGADLFAAEQAGFVRTVLSTPLPADGEWATELLHNNESQATPEPRGPAAERRGHGGAVGARGSAMTDLGEYRSRAATHASEIEALRGVWRRVISERIGLRNALTRLPQAEGDLLARDHLVSIVADVAAGVERPRAFQARERRRHRVHRAGSTDYVLLIDRSASMQGAAAEAAADAALIVLESLAAVQRDIAAEERASGIDLELSLRTALIVFDSEAEVVKPLAGALDDTARRRMHAAVMQSGGSTNDAAALAAATRELGLSPRTESGTVRGGEARSTGGIERQRVVIFISDGGTDDGGASAAEVRKLRAAGVTVLGVGLRSDELVRRFAPDGVRVDAPAQLTAALTRLVVAAGLEGRAAG